MELDYRRHNDMACVTNIEKQSKHTTKDRVYIFLKGLDHSLYQVSGCVLAISFLLSLKEVFSLVRREA